MELDSSQFDVMRERFIELNRERLVRTQSDLKPNQRDFLVVLPLLFHVNHNSLPGYCGPDAPFGVSAYAFDDSVVNTAKKLWRGFDIKKRAQWAYAIESIFLMGSAGTIAFSSKSDFDIWLCYKPGLNETQLGELQKKATGIEKWAADIGLEAHFFLMNAEEFKAGKIVDLSSESSGSAQHRLLLDEFYRTGIWVSGKHPFWWFVPPEHESEYEAVKEIVREKQLLDEDECIDFGSLPMIPAEEFLGAAVWQLYKGVDSPFKSILKITLMEAYADEYPDGKPLSTYFKEKVYEGDLTLDTLDPYMMLLNCLETYLRNKQDRLRLELIRRSFYFKIGILLTSEAAKLKKDWRHALLRELVKNWGWNEHQLAHHDAHRSWKIDDVILENKLLVDHLSKSYMFLSNFARQFPGESMIKQKDLTILGRKLYAVFDKKPGKIEQVSHGISNVVAEDVVTVFLAHDKQKRDRWLLYRGKATKNDFKNLRPLFRADGLIELLAWAYFNRAIAMNTQKLLYAPGTDMKNAEVHTILESITRLCPDPKGFTPDGDVLKYATRVDNVLAFVNVGKVPKVVGASVDKEIISGALDILKYGTLEESLMLSMEMIYTTTWREVYVLRYDGMNGLMKWMCNFLSFSLRQDGMPVSEPISIPEVFSFSSHFGHILTKRIKDLANDVFMFFYEQNNVQQGAFVVEAVKCLFVISREGARFVSQRFENQARLMSYLALPQESFRNVGFDKISLRKSPLPMMYQNNRNGMIQLYYERQGEETAIFIVDENGSLFTQKLKDKDVVSILNHYYHFFKTNLIRYQLDGVDEKEREKEFIRRENELIELNSIKKEGFEYIFKSVELNSVKHAKSPYQLVAEGQVINSRTVFNFKCKDKAFSSAQHGGKVFELVRAHLQSQRQLAQDYPLYITGVELSEELVKKNRSGHPQSQYLLSYKKRIEEKLNAD